MSDGTALGLLDGISVGVPLGCDVGISDSITVGLLDGIAGGSAAWVVAVDETVVLKQAPHRAGPSVVRLILSKERVAPHTPSRSNRSSISVIPVSVPQLSWFG